jgi:1-phosphatidylinositol-3-phosphate 5-kinase
VDSLTVCGWYQFEVLRELFYGSLPNFLGSIAHVADWKAKGGKSGASFFRTLDDRFVVKHISSTEMQVRVSFCLITT